MCEESKTIDMLSRYHTHPVSRNQCGSTNIQIIHAPLALVWSVVRQFDNPQAYKPFISTCAMRPATVGVGSVRYVCAVTGLPAKTSVERLDHLDDDGHIMQFSIVGGDHRLGNYQSTLTLHESKGGDTVVTESYVVDVPAGSTGEETCIFTNTIVRCNLRSLAHVTEHKALDLA